MAKEPDIVVEFAAQPQYLALIRTFIGCFCSHLGLASEEALQLEICVDEACANSIEGIQALEGTHPKTRIRIELTLHDNGVQLSVVDQGRDFSYHFRKAAPLADYSDRTRRRGYGLQIIKTLMDDVHYSHDPGLGNRLSFVKYFSSK